MTDQAQIERLFDAYVAAFRAGDADACGSFYAQDAEYIACGMAPLSGRQAIADLHREIIASGFELDALHTDELVVSGNLAYLCQRLEGGSGTSDVMIVMRREPDGGWLVHAEAEIAR